MKKYIILNFGYGFGPFLRSLELAIATNDIFETRLGFRFGIIVPWVYDHHQLRIIRENFSDIIEKYPNEILFDRRLGKILNSMFYGDKSFDQALSGILQNHQSVYQLINHYFDTGLVVENISGQNFSVKKNEIAFEISRNARFDFGITPSYASSFGYTSEIIQRSLAEKNIKFDKDILEKSIAYFIALESKHRLIFISEPATFSFLNPELPQKYPSQIMAPPSIKIKPSTLKAPRQGIYLTVTGIAQAEKIFKEISDFGMVVYTNKPQAIPGSIPAPPSLVADDNIILHIGRSGWGSVWLSQYTNTPFITPEYNTQDDPEIYFNNLYLENCGLGKIYRGQSLQELLDFKQEYQKNVEKINSQLIKKYKTLDGVKFISEQIADDYIKNQS